MIQLGKLNFTSVTEHIDSLAPVVAQVLKQFSHVSEIGFTFIDPTLSDTSTFCLNYDIEMDVTANCVVLEASRTDRTWLFACLVLGSHKIDVNGVVRRTVDARRVSFASRDVAVSESHMEYGAVTPIGLPDDWKVLVDEHVCTQKYIVVGSGKRDSKLLVPGHLVSKFPGVEVLPDIAKTS